MNKTTQVSLTELQKANAQAPQCLPSSSAGQTYGFDTPAGFEMLQRAAKMLSSGTIFPERFRNNIGDCAI
ncbi:MAG: hypothetical protein LUJ25_06085, partial [Firmicutes bacterium]|nr:hypothetical protein [Bacillota bacterium]